MYSPIIVQAIGSSGDGQIVQRFGIESKAPFECVNACHKKITNGGVDKIKKDVPSVCRPGSKPVLACEPPLLDHIFFLFLVDVWRGLLCFLFWRDEGTVGRW